MEYKLKNDLERTLFIECHFQMDRNERALLLGFEGGIKSTSTI